jgi:hypothetical protein
MARSKKRSKLTRTPIWSGIEDYAMRESVDEKDGVKPLNDEVVGES